VIDTPGAAILFNTDAEVRHFEFSDYAVVGSNCQVADRFGSIIWSADGADDLEEVRSGPVGWVHGISVPTLENGGVLRVYFV